MGRNERRAAYAALERHDNMEAICLFLGDRANVETKLASDIVPLIHEHLEGLGSPKRLGLVLFARGGVTPVPLRVVELCREYCTEFLVYVPYRAHSAATMICLGADTVYMSPLGELSPIDPTVTSPLIPKVDGKDVGIGIEDVISFLELAEERGGLSDQDVMAKVFLHLSEAVGPTVLGNINRTSHGIRAIANQLLDLRTNKSELNAHVRKDLIEALTSKLYFHDRPICRREAVDIGMKFVAEKDVDRDRLMLDVYRTYASDLNLSRPFIPSLVESETSKEIVVPGAYLESKNLSHAFIFGGSVISIGQLPPGVPADADVPRVGINWRSKEWQLTEDE